MAVFVSHRALEWLLAWLAVSEGACLLERLVREPAVIQPMLQSRERDTSNVLRSEANTATAYSGAEEIIPQPPFTSRQARVAPTQASSPTSALPPPTRLSMPGTNLPAPPAHAPVPAAFTTICYLDSAPIRVRGLSTGRSYESSAAQAIQRVDSRDVSALLGTLVCSAALSGSRLSCW